MICRIVSRSWMLNVTIWIFILLCQSVTSQKDGEKQTQNVAMSHTGALNDLRSIVDKAVSNNSAVFNVRQRIATNNASVLQVPSTSVSNMKTSTWNLSEANNSSLGLQPVVVPTTAGNTNNPTAVETTKPVNTESEKALTNVVESKKKDKVAAFSWSSYSKNNKTAFYIPMKMLSRRKRQTPFNVNVDPRRNRRVLLLMNPNNPANQTVRLDGRNTHMLVRHNGTNRSSPNMFSQHNSQGSMPSTGLQHSNQITKVQEVVGQSKNVWKPAMQSIGNLNRINLDHSLTATNATRNNNSAHTHSQSKNVTRVTRQSPRRLPIQGSINLINPTPRQSVRNQTGNIRQTHRQVGPGGPVGQSHIQRSSNAHNTGRIANTFHQQAPPRRTPSLGHTRTGPRIQQFQPRVPLPPPATRHTPSRVIPVVTRRQGHVNPHPHSLLRPNVEAQLAHQQPVSSRRIPPSQQGTNSRRIPPSQQGTNSRRIPTSQQGTGSRRISTSQQGSISQSRPSWQRPSRPLVTRVSHANLRRQQLRFDPRARPVPRGNIGQRRRRPTPARIPRMQMMRRRTRPPDPFTRRFAAGFQRGSNLLIQPPMDFTGFDGSLRENVGFGGGPRVPGLGGPGGGMPGAPPFGGMPPGFPPMFPGIGPGFGPPGPFMFR